MAFTARKYGQASLHAYQKRVNWLTDTVKVMLVTSGYVPNQDTHDYLDDTTNEVSGTGYTAGGITLANKTLTYDAATNTLKFDADDVTWANSTITARGFVIYVSTGTASTSPLLAYGMESADLISNNGALSLVWDTAGIFTHTIA
jgi:hypothetical protein